MFQKRTAIRPIATKFDTEKLSDEMRLLQREWRWRLRRSAHARAALFGSILCSSRLCAGWNRGCGKTGYLHGSGLSWVGWNVQRRRWRQLADTCSMLKNRFAVHQLALQDLAALRLECTLPFALPRRLETRDVVRNCVRIWMFQWVVFLKKKYRLMHTSLE